MPAVALSEAGYTSTYGIKMRTVYLIKSSNYPQRTYIGTTSDLSERLKRHNADRSSHTNKCGPWEVIVAIQFKDVRKANAFERYLKSGSGRAFAKKHFW
jgi:predicted GIY-YIG superfamily endonuclease